MNTQDTNPHLINARDLQRAMGYGALLLPIALIIGVYLPLQNDDYILPTMSEFVYTGAQPIFIGAVFSLAIMFFAYQGYPGRAGRSPFTDRQLAKIAGACAMLTATFPASTCIQTANGTELTSNFDFAYASHLHFVGAAGLFISMAWFCLFHFTLSSDANPRPTKRRRNGIYRNCGTTIVAGIVAISLMQFNSDAVSCTHLNMMGYFPIVFVIEAIMTVAFAVAWLVKSGEFFADY